MKKTALLILSFVMWSCFCTAQLSEKGSCSSDSGDSSDSDQVIEMNLDSVRLYLSGIKAVRDSIEKQLIQATPEQADTMLEHRPNFIYLQCFINLEVLLEPYMDRYYYGGEVTKTDSVISDMLHYAGLVFADVGEGYCELQLEQYYYYKLYGKYLSEPAREFLHLWSNNNTLYMADAALAVDIDTLYNRSLLLEEYVRKYPGTQWQKYIYEDYSTYMSDIMFCIMSNTTTFDCEYDDSGELINAVIGERNLNEIRRLKRTGRGTMTNKIISRYLAILSKQEYKYSEVLEKDIRGMYEFIKPKTSTDENFSEIEAKHI